MLLSRVAETSYWLSRYLERAENTARMINVNGNLLLDLPKEIEPGWESLLGITGSSSLFHEHYDDASEKNVVRFLISDRRNPNSIVSALSQARENLRTMRAIFPQGAWEILNDLYYFSDEKKVQGINRKGRYEYLKQVVRSCQAFAGNVSGSMSHDQTYEFVRIGRNIERADMTSRVLDVRATGLIPEGSDELMPFDDIQWKSVLDSLAGYQMYRRHVHVRVTGSAVLDFLVQDKDFPRSILYCLSELECSLRALPSNEAALRSLGGAQRLAREVDVHERTKAKLSGFANEIQIALGRVHEQIAASYFRVTRIKQDPPAAPRQAQVNKENAA